LDEGVPESISPPEKSESSRNRPDRGRSRSNFKTARVRLPMQILLIVLVFAVGLLIMTVVMRQLDQPNHPAPQQYDGQ
jgi:hypothetical protein